MSQCDRCGQWFGVIAWTCSACQNLAAAFLQRTR